jgi:uncharacterized membrane protein
LKSPTANRDPSAKMPTPWIVLLATWMLAAVLAVSILSPPLIVPDEAAQFERAVYVSSGHALTIPMSDGLGVRIDDAYFDFRDAVAAMRDHLELMDRGAIHTLSAITLRHSDASVAVPNTGNYPFITYLPQATGIKIAAIFTDRVFFHAIGGRIANGALAVALLILAVRLCPVIAPTLLTTAALPVSIFLSASLSQDASLIALSALLAALLVRMLVKGSSAAALAICTTIVIVLALARPPYTAFLLALVVVHGSATKWREPATLAAATIAALIVVGAYCKYISTVGKLNLIGGADPSAQLRVMAADPFLIFRALIAAAKQKGASWLGGIIGMLDRPLPVPVYLVYSGALIFAAAVQVAVFRSSRYLVIGPIGAIVVAGAGAIQFIASAFLIALLLFLTWTEVGGEVLMGVQGRYLLEPALMAVPLVLCPLMRSPEQLRKSQFVLRGTVALIALLAASTLFVITLLLSLYWAWPLAAAP